MCRNGQYTERGIKEIDGFMSERWRTEPEYAIKVDPSLGILGVLLEPTTVVTKALEHVHEIGRRSFWETHRVLVTGAGPIGLLAALIAKLHGREVHVLDRMETGSKPELVRALGAIYHSGSVKEIGFEPDAIVECTGSRAVDCRFDSDGRVKRDRLSDWRRSWGVVTSAACRHCCRGSVEEQRDFCSVNANKRHWYRAAEFLARADRSWLAKLITRRVRPEKFMNALGRKPDDIKVVVQFSDI
jgi:threonine dehydrogenase-like Zn-dependent dehydrogenase